MEGHRMVGLMVSNRSISADAQRIGWIDCAKGFAILLVIAGHSVGGVWRAGIFSFHMPLFFILSCVTYRYSSSMREFRTKLMRAFRHLIVPAVSIFLLQSVIYALQNIDAFRSADYMQSYIIKRVCTFLFASGVEVQVLGKVIPALGIPWFLVVLFLGRTLFDFLHLKLKQELFVTVCMILGVAGVWLGDIQWLPFSFDIALAVMPFFLFGTYLKTWNVQQHAFRKAVLWFWGWFFTLLVCCFAEQSYLELACRRYTLFPLCYFTAIAGTMTAAEASAFLPKWKALTIPIAYVGRYSLYMLCVHMMDYLWRPLWQISHSGIINVMIRVGMDCLVFAGVMLAKRYKSA